MSGEMTNFGPNVPQEGISSSSGVRRSTVQPSKRATYQAPLSAQTRSMSRVNTHYNLQLASLAQDHKPNFGGLRRKREPLLDALIAVSGSDAIEKENGDIRSGDSPERERPRKMARVGQIGSSSSRIEMGNRLDKESSTNPAPVQTPQRKLANPFGPSYNMAPGTPTMFLPRPASPAESDSSEDSMLLKPTPRKVLGSGRGDEMKGMSDGRGGNGARRRLWVDGSESRAAGAISRRGDAACERGTAPSGGTESALPPPTANPMRSSLLSIDNQAPKPPSSVTQTSSIGPIRRTPGTSHSISGLPRAPSSYALPTKSSLAAAALRGHAAEGSGLMFEKDGKMGSVSKGSASFPADSMGGGMGRAEIRVGSQTGLSAKSLSQASVTRRLGPPAIGGGLHKRSSTLSGSLSTFNLSKVAEGALLRTTGLGVVGKSSSEPVNVDTSHTAAKPPSQSAEQQALPTVSKLPLGVRKPSSMSHTPTVRAQPPPLEVSPNFRRPTYPSSLGSGPLAKQTSRVVSNPVISKETLRKFSANEHDVVDGILPSSTTARSSVGMRAVSDPAHGSSLARSASIRNGLGDDAAKGLTGLNAAMAKLQMMKSLGGGGGGGAKPLRVGEAASADEDRMAVDAEESNTTAMHLSSLGKSLSGLPRPRAPGPPSSYRAPMAETATSASDGAPPIPAGTRRISGSATLRDLMSIESGRDSLKGVTAFVDVRTSEGDDSSSIFAEMLKACGAKVLTRPTESTTHVIFKSGASSTLAWWRRQEEPRPHIVGIGWVTRCKEVGQLVPEETYAVNVEDQAVFQRRRKSMEPRHLASIMGGAGGGVPGITLTGPTGPHSTLQSIAHARRQSTQFMPKISSPLKKTAGRQYRSFEVDED